MVFLVIGAGLMGPAAAYNALVDPRVGRVILADRDASQLASAAARLARFDTDQKFETLIVDLDDRASSAEAFARADVILSALPWSASLRAFDAALGSRVPIVDLAIPGDDDLPELRRAVDEAGGLVVLGAGLEPGLTEIWARRLAEGMDGVTDLHIKVGGVPEVPSGPLGYKIVFGGTELPLRDMPALVVRDGRAVHVQRYSEAEPVEFERVGELEAWNEGVLPWILDLPEFASLTSATQKTIRWPGYAERATALLELGLLSTVPINVRGSLVAPKAVVDTVLAPWVTMSEGECDVTLFRVEVGGVVAGRRVVRRADMVDRCDPVLGFTSMARTTAFTGAIIARMIGRGEITERGLYTPELLITGDRFERLIGELAGEGVGFKE